MSVLGFMGCAIFHQHGTVTSDALGTPFAAFALGVLSAFACNGLFAEAADLVEKGMAIYLSTWWVATNRWGKCFHAMNTHTIDIHHRGLM